MMANQIKEFLIKVQAELNNAWLQSSYENGYFQVDKRLLRPSHTCLLLMEKSVKILATLAKN